MDAELESNVGEKGESLAHNRIVPLREAEATFLFSGLAKAATSKAKTSDSNIAGARVKPIGWRRWQPT
jgi:hypothetical protein